MSVLEDDLSDAEYCRIFYANVMLNSRVLNNLHVRILIFLHIRTPAVAFPARFVWMKQGCSVPPAPLNKCISLRSAW